MGADHVLDYTHLKAQLDALQLAPVPLLNAYADSAPKTIVPLLAVVPCATS